MKGQWEGHYLDGRTAERHRVVVRLMRSGLEIVTETGGILWWPYGEIRQTQGFYAGEQVRFERGGELAEALLVADAGFLKSLHAAAAEPGGHFHNPARRRLRLRLTVLAAIAVIGVTAVLYVWGIPGLASLAASRVPVAWEERLGQAVADQLAPAAERCTDQAGARAIGTIVATLTRPFPDTPYAFRVIVRDSPAVNAFAAPGGHIVLLRGLLQQAETPEALAGVLAHEMQHVLLRHPTRALFQHASTGLLVAALSGDPTGVMAYGLEAARTLGTLRHSRENEEEADVQGTRMLLAAGIDARGMVTFLESLDKAGRDRPALSTYLSTHPSSAQRVARLRALVASPPRAPVTLLSDEEWLALRNICAGRAR